MDEHRESGNPANYRNRPERMRNIRYPPPNNDIAGLPTLQTEENHYLPVAVSDIYLHRHRLRRNREEDSGGTVRDVVNRLNEPSTNFGSNASQRGHYRNTSDESDGAPSNSNDMTFLRRTKRRKLNPHNPTTPIAKISYGHYGQVVPGKLKMHVLSCDHNPAEDLEIRRDGPVRTWLPETILQKDSSAFHTGRDSLSLILGHWGQTPFCLTKLVIKTPAKSIPLQEGMIFVSMTSNDLLLRTSQYRPRDVPRSFRNTIPSTGGPINTLYTANQPQYSPGGPGVVRIRTYVGDGEPAPQGYGYQAALRMFPRMGPVYGLPQPQQRPTALGPDISASPTRLGPSRDSSAPTPSPESSRSGSPTEFNVNTSCDDPSGDSEYDSGEDTTMGRPRSHYTLETASEEEDYRSRPTTTRSWRRKIEWVGDSRVAGGSANPSAMLERLEPHARFFVDEEMRMITIKFEPHVSGKFVLLKLWSSLPGRSIDLQNVTAYGYGGTRFIPAVQLR